MVVSLDANLLRECNDVVDELNEWRKLEESIRHAQVHANEIRDEDKNTKYFHHKASQHKKEI